MFIAPFGSVEHERRAIARLELQRTRDALPDDHAVAVSLLQPPAGGEDEVGSETRLAVRFQPLSHDREIAAPVREQAGKPEALHHIVHLWQGGNPGSKLLGLRDEVLVRLPRARGEVAGLRDLEVTGLRMDERLAQLDEDVLDEAAAQDDSDDAEHDRGERHAGAHPLALHVARRETG